MTLDKRDLQLLYLLDIDGRSKQTYLAKRLRLSKQMVKYRVERLEREGYIKGYYAMIDSSKLGYTTFRIYLKFRGSEAAEAAIEHCKSHKNIWAVVRIAGKWDLALGVGVKDIYSFYEVWDGLLKEYLPRIRDYAVCLYSPIYHYTKDYLASPERTKTRILGGHQEVSHDKKDLKLLVALSKDARTPLTKLAETIKLTPEAAKYRLRKLEKTGVIQGYRAMIEVAKMGYEFYKAEIRLAKYTNISPIMEYCQRHPNIYQLDRTIGGETLEIEFHVKDLTEMLAVMKDFEAQFPESLDSFTYITVLGEEKTTYMPE